MTKISPIDRRLAAASAIVDRELGQPWVGTLADADRERVAKDIEALASLGRTARWHDAIAMWARMVRERENATHALTQWCIFTGYAA